ncbi:MAG: polyprenol monophosphomannose synthase [Planctomycetota bacterium]|nr:MAG: polyprenol monophosphomannose synthase [Planctomycetota bacterium]
MSAPHPTLVTLATYNEIENLPRLIEAILAAVPEVDILVIDDNSPDGTGRWCDEQAEQEPRLRCLHREGKLGLGTATIAGMQYAIEYGYRYVLNMDADFSHHPRHLPAMLAGMEGGDPPTDVMIGSRYVAGGGVEGWPLHRQIMSRTVNAYARLLLGLRARDCSGAFRCYRVSLLEQVDFNEVRSRGYSFQEEILWRLKRLGATMRETPITFADRERGASKINGSEAFAALRILFRLGLENWFSPRRNAFASIPRGGASATSETPHRAPTAARGEERGAGNC